MRERLSAWRGGWAAGLMLAAGTALPAWAGGELGGAACGERVAGCGPVCGHARAAAAAVMTDELAEDGAGPSALVGPLEAIDATDVQSVRLELELIDPANNQNISGTCTYVFTVAAPTVNQFTVRLRSQFAVGTVVCNGLALPAGNVTAPSATTRVITLNRVYLQGETVTLAIPYSGQAISRGFGSAVFTFQNGVPAVSTLSQPYFAYTWWPAKDGDFGQPGDNADKFTWSMDLITPAGLSGLSNGVYLGTDTLPSGKLRHRWASNYPMSTYLAFFAATSYGRTVRTWTYPGGSMPLEYWIFSAQNTDANRAQLDAVVPPALTLFSQLWGVYPFAAEKYGIYQYPQGGGMEHQTFTGQADFGEDLSVHELAHQWWGDHVTCRTWADIGFNEGQATYAEALWAEKKPGSSGLPALKAAMASRRPTPGTGPVYKTDSSNANTLFDYYTTYAKAGWVFHMLRGVVGEPAYLQILAAIRANYGGGTITSEQLASTASAVSGRDLTGFFNQWWYGTGEPSYARGFDTVTVNGQRYARFHIRQTQSATYGSGGLFRMPLDIDLRGASGTTRVRVENFAGTQWYVRPVPEAVTGVTIDPDAWVLVTSYTSEALPSGPPVVVQTLPAPGQTVAIAPASVDVFFSAGVAVSAGQLALSRTPPGGGAAQAVPFSFAYDAALNRARLTPTATLAPGSYTLTVLDTVTATTGGARLDGEVSPAVNAALLPSGNGVAGGNAVIAFTVATPAGCPVDYNRDGFTNLDDLGDFITDFYTVPPIPGGAQAAAPTYAGQAVGFGQVCPAAPDAPGPYASEAYRTQGYRVGYSGDGGNACPFDAAQPFPNLDNLNDFITGYYGLQGTPGC